MADVTGKQYTWADIQIHLNQHLDAMVPAEMTPREIFTETVDDLEWQSTAENVDSWRDSATAAIKPFDPQLADLTLKIAAAFEAAGNHIAMRRGCNG